MCGVYMELASLRQHTVRFRSDCFWAELLLFFYFSFKNHQ